MTFLIDRFPDDQIVRQLVAIDGIEPVPTRTNERRWRVVLRRVDNHQETTHSVSANYLFLMSLGSLWKAKRHIGFNKNWPEESTFELFDDGPPKFIWKTGGHNSLMFCDASVLEKNMTSGYPAYQILYGFRNGFTFERICVSVNELIRFYIGRSPAFSRHLFEFRESLQNPRLYRFLGENFLNGTPSKIEFADKNLGYAGQKLLVSMLSNKVGKEQLLSVSRTARSAISQNKRLNGKLTKVFPLFGMPHEQEGEFSGIGLYKQIFIDDEHGGNYVQIFGVSRITNSGHDTPSQDMTVLVGGGRKTSNPIPGPSKGKYPLPDIPHDVPEPSNSDTEILVAMGVDFEDDYPGLKNVELNEEVVFRDGLKNPYFENEGGQLIPIDRLSTERGGDTGGATGYARVRDDKLEPVIQKPLHLVDPSLPDLMTCRPEIELTPQDVISVSYIDVPDRLKLVAACICKTNSGLSENWRKGFFGNTKSINEISLLSLNRFVGEEILEKTGKHRRALVAELSNDQYRVIFADIERTGLESIGIFTLLVPINIDIEWDNISYILEYRLKFGTWPNPNTHGGGYVAKVQKHKSFFVDNDLLARTLHKFVWKLEEQATFI